MERPGCHVKSGGTPCPPTSTEAALPVFRHVPLAPERKTLKESLFNRKSFPWTANQQVLQQHEADGCVTQKPGRRPDYEDPFVVSRGWLCAELEQGQTEELVIFRVILDQKKFDQAVQKVPPHELFAADCSERFFKLFIRGDESSPVLLGEFGGKVCPDLTVLSVTEVTREVFGHRIAGTMETLPCLEVTVVKAPGFQGLWEDLLHSEEDVLNRPQGTLEEFQAQQLRREREPSPDREDWTPDDWADEQKDKADAAFKEGSYRDAAVYYTRALRYTPLSEKLLSNRSAAYLKLKQYQLALDDALKAQQVQPGWSKLYFRSGQACRGLRRFEESIAAFAEGQRLDPANPEWEREVQRTRDVQVALEEKRKAKVAR